MIVYHRLIFFNLWPKTKLVTQYVSQYLYPNNAHKDVGRTMALLALHWWGQLGIGLHHLVLSKLLPWSEVNEHSAPGFWLDDAQLSLDVIERKLKDL